MLRLTGVMHLVLAAVLLAASLSAHAITYSYQGNALVAGVPPITQPCVFGDPGCAISAITVSLDFGTALAADLAIGNVTPDAWAISDGLTTVTDMTPGIDPTFPIFAIQVGTDSLGDIDEWYIDINPLGAGSVGVGEWSGMRTRNTSGTIDDQTRYCQAGSCSQQGLALLLGSPGTWTTIPLPAAVWLFGGALGALLGVRRRRAA
jgi:hypothetical protein